MPQMAISNPRQGDGQIYMKTNRAGKRSALNHQPVKAGGNVLPDSPIHTQKDPRQTNSLVRMVGIHSLILPIATTSPVAVTTVHVVLLSEFLKIAVLLKHGIL